MFSTVSTVGILDKHQPQEAVAHHRGFLSRRLRALSKTKKDKFKELCWKSSSGWVVDEFFINLDLEQLKALENSDEDRKKNELFLVEKENKLKELLRSNQHYLVSWMGFSVDDNLPKSEAACCLQKNPEKVQELLESLFSSPNNCLRSTKKIADHVYADDGSAQILVLFFVEAYIAIAYQGGRKGGQAIGETWSPDRLIKIGRKFGYQLVGQAMSSDYLPGVEYLHKYADLHNILSKQKGIEKVNLNEYSPDEEFEILPGKSKALLLAAKALVWSAMRTMIPSARDTCCEVLKEIIRLDPDHYEWHYQIGSYLRLSRRRVDSRACITFEEETILWETYDKCRYRKYNDDGSDSDLNRKAYAGVIQGLAEKVRFRDQNKVPRNTPLTFGDLEFQGDEEAVQYIMDGIKKIMANIDNPDLTMSPNYAESIRCGDILSSILPNMYKDYVSAEKYFLHALTKAGTYSKIYHKLGVLYSRAEQVKDHNKALKYLRLCYSVDPTNVPGATDLIKTLMKFAEKHASEITAVICNAKLSPALHSRDECVFYFIEGCLQYILGNVEAAIDSWISAEKCIEKGKENFRYPMESVFQNFHSVKQLNWNFEVLNPKEILKVFTELLRNPSSENFSVEKIQFLEKSQKYLSTLAPIRTYNNYRKETGANKDIIQRRARCISEQSDPPKVRISDRDSNWRGTSNRDRSGGNSASVDSSDFNMYSNRTRTSSYQQGEKRNWKNNQNQNFNRRNYQGTDLKNNRQTRRSPSPESWR